METKYNVEKVAVTVHLTPEAARTLRAYAGERNRGRFLSDLIMEQRRRDELEGQRIANEASQRPVEASQRPVEASQRPVEASQRPVEAPKKVQSANQHISARNNKRRKRR